MNGLKNCMLLLSTFLVFSCSQKPSIPEFEVVIRNGAIYDGLGGEPYQSDIAVKDGKIAIIGDVGKATGQVDIDATGKAVSPGFINMLSWATETLIEDGRSMSDIHQGVTLEVMGEGWSMGPLNDRMRNTVKEDQSSIEYDVPWRTLGEYLQWLEDRGVSPNIASFVGATTIRVHELGYEDRAPTPEELDRMKALVREAMEEGAMGVGSSLIYAPAFYSSTEELIELSKVAGEYGGMYISHLRSEGNRILESLDELIEIAEKAGCSAEVYHLKLGGRQNWDKFDQVIEKIEAARARGVRISTNMYTYTAGATGLDAAMPPWVQEGGYEAWAKRLQDPEIRKRVKAEMDQNTDDWENLYYAAGADKMILVGFKSDELRPLTGKTLAEVAEMRGTSTAETAMDLVVEDGSQVGTIYFLMSEENVKKKIALPYMSFGSDGGSPAAEGVFLKSSPHPRTYGNFARLLGKYVREEKVIPLQEAVRKLTSLPASNLGIKGRGQLSTGYAADIVIFDPNKVQDNATFENSHQYATGVSHVFVNGIQVVKDGVHTGAKPGQIVRGPGYKPKN